MTARTFDDIVLEGCLKAGDEGVVPRVQGYFNDWLQRQARSWPWPSLTTQWRGTVSPGNFVLTSQDGMPDRQVSRIIDNVWLYSADGRQRWRLRITQREDVDLVAALIDPGAVGRPTSVTGVPDVDTGHWAMVFDKRADATYILSYPAVIVPERITSGSGSKPWYPEDDTCIQACMTETLLYKNGPDDPSYQAALEVLSSMVQADRVRYGTTASQGDLWSLDKGVFR